MRTLLKITLITSGNIIFGTWKISGKKRQKGIEYFKYLGDNKIDGDVELYMKKLARDR